MKIPKNLSTHQKQFPLASYLFFFLFASLLGASTVAGETEQSPMQPTTQPEQAPQKVLNPKFELKFASFVYHFSDLTREPPEHTELSNNFLTSFYVPIEDTAFKFGIGTLKNSYNSRCF